MRRTARLDRAESVGREVRVPMANDTPAVGQRHAPLGEKEQQVVEDCIRHEIGFVQLIGSELGARGNGEDFLDRFDAIAFRDVIE